MAPILHLAPIWMGFVGNDLHYKNARYLSILYAPLPLPPPPKKKKTDMYIQRDIPKRPKIDANCNALEVHSETS